MMVGVKWQGGRDNRSPAWSALITQLLSASRLKKSRVHHEAAQIPKVVLKTFDDLFQ